MGTFATIISDVNAQLTNQLAERDPPETPNLLVQGAQNISGNHDGSKIFCVPVSSDYGPPRFNSSQAKPIFSRSLVVDFYCFGASIDDCLKISEELLEALQELYAKEISIVGDRWPSQDEKGLVGWHKELCILQVAFKLTVFGKAYKQVTVNEVKHTNTPTPNPGELTCKP